jgi:signal transduction histidine kinase
VSKRLDWLRRGSPHRFERHLPDGRRHRYPRQCRCPGGFVTTYTDISDYREVVTSSRRTRTELESRVASGSRSLSEANAELRREVRLRAEAETRLREANQSKSRFMSATSHDLLQPINAARLFAASLRPRLVDDDEATANLGNIDDALGRAED